MDSQMLDFLYCPQTGSKLTLQDGELYTSKTSYPIFNDIPWLFQNPELSFLEWSAKVTTHLKNESTYLEYLSLLIKGESANKTQMRLKKLVEAKQYNLQHEQNILSIFLDQPMIDLQPSSQQIHSYSKLIFRDWCWSNTENQMYFEFIKKMAPENPGKILILGAGAGKLSQLVSNHYSSSMIFSIDHNPYLLFTANKVFNNEEISLYDYSFSPNTLENTNRFYTIKENINIENHAFILSKFPHLPFAKESIDLIISPWFYDILGENLNQSILNTLKYMKNDATLIQIGPSNFHNGEVNTQYCLEEITETYSKYFSHINYENSTLKYCNNPIESSSRNENVLCICASSKKKISQKNKNGNNENSLKYTPALEAYKQNISATHQILDHITQDVSQKELAKIIQNTFKISEIKSEFYAESFIKKLKLEL